MKRFFHFVALMLLGSSAQAGNSFSFVVGGHRIRIDAPRSCRSPSCVSVSIPGFIKRTDGRKQRLGSHRTMRRRAVRICAQSTSGQQGRDGAQHEAESGGPVDREYL
jgi:hypothetical protein